MTTEQEPVDYVAWLDAVQYLLPYSRKNTALELAHHLTALKELVDHQAEDGGLWFIAQTAPEAYLQQELRRLHSAIELITHQSNA